MKRTIIFLFILLVAKELNAQMILAPNKKFVSELDSSAYIVKEYPEISQSVLYARVKQYIVQTYNSPKTVLSENSPTSISIFGVETYNGLLVNHIFTYKIVFTFKESKVKIDVSLVSLEISEGRIVMGEVVIFDSHGKVRKIVKKLVESCNNTINGVINGVDTSIKNAGSTNDNW
ncbi:MAG TPA: hypothetical protein VIK55_15870 [Paludibacter sp.]